MANNKKTPGNQTITKYRDGIKSIGHKIGMACDAYLRANMYTIALIDTTWSVNAEHMQSTRDNIALVLSEQYCFAQINSEICTSILSPFQTIPIFLILNFYLLVNQLCCFCELCLAFSGIQQAIWILLIQTKLLIKSDV